MWPFKRVTKKTSTSTTNRYTVSNISNDSIVNYGSGSYFGSSSSLNSNSGSYFSQGGHGGHAGGSGSYSVNSVYNISSKVEDIDFSYNKDNDINVFLHGVGTTILPKKKLPKIIFNLLDLVDKEENLLLQEAIERLELVLKLSI